MRVKFLKDAKLGQIGPGDTEFKADEEYDLPQASAQRWIRRQMAVAVDDKPRGKAKPEALIPLKGDSV